MCNADSCALAAEPSAAYPGAAGAKPIRVQYFTDPICSTCWGIKPQLRRLKLEYGYLFHLEYRMGVLLPTWEDFNRDGIRQPADVAGHWDEASALYNMPFDGNIWLEDPLESSVPPSLAYLAARLQDEKQAIFYLRRLREMVFMEKMNIARPEMLERAAVEMGLDPVQLRRDMHHTAPAMLEEDLALCKTLGVKGFPTFFFATETGDRLRVYGNRPYHEYVNAVKALCPGAEPLPYDKSIGALIVDYGSLTVREYAELADLDMENARQKLEAAVVKGEMRVVRTRNGALYRG